MKAKWVMLTVPVVAATLIGAVSCSPPSVGHGPGPTSTTTSTTTTSTTVPSPVPVTQYNCPNGPQEAGHYVPANDYWQNDFVAQGSTITGGYLLVGAQTGDHDHHAVVGVYGGAGLADPLGTVVVNVVGYGGQTFTFSPPITVSPGQPLYLAASGIGDFTAYDNLAAGDCFVGSLQGYQ